MESSGASKRTADSDLSADTYAVCTNCSRLSLNLQNCDKCGSTLSAENSAGCYSSEPKRARTDTEAPSPSPSNGNLVNGNGPQSNTSSPDNTPTPVPVPQALYKNKNANTGPDEVNIRPQALFSHLAAAAATTASAPTLSPVISSTPVPSNLLASVAAAAGGNAPPQMPSLNSLIPPNRAVLASVPGMDSATLNLMSAAVSGAVPTLGAQQRLQAQTLQTSSAAPRVSLPSYNLQPPAPPQYPLSNVQRPVQDSNVGAAANQAGSAASSSNAASAANNSVGAGNPHKLSVEPNCVSIPALEIRIGAQKFKPITAVSFKDDGILFTLKDYTYAPVLLNARAILRCKANMNLLNYPVFLLYLEASCMKQIRNIFGLKDEDFGENNPCELKRCISIFPSITNESAPDVIRLNVVAELQHMFSLMEKRYMRYNKILEEMMPEEALDIMLALLNSNNIDVSRTNGTGPGTSPAVPNQQRQDRSRLSTSVPAMAAQPPRGQPAPRPAPPPLHNNIAVHRPISGFPPNIHYNRPSTVNVNSVPPRNMPPISTGSTGQQPVFRATNPAGPRGPPTLQIPTDTARWQELQRSLVVGGVYHVQQPGAAKKTMYCLWNGTQLVPCLVQNTEVQLDCEQVWVGSFRAKALSHVRVKADNTQGLFVTIDKDNRTDGRKDLDFRLPDIITCHVCVDQRMSCMFVELSDSGADRIRKTLSISHYNDPAYNPRCNEERRKHLILFLKNVNQDQWEALTSMKFTGRRNNLFTKIEVLKALKILADIKSNSRVQAKITDWINKKALPSNLIAVENIAKELSNPNDDVSAAADDDDDVIMTQEEVGVKCPYTQQVMKEPIKNKICGHNYEKSAINEFMLRKKGNAKCPYAGCGNAVPLRMSDLEDNFQLKEYIRKNVK